MKFATLAALLVLSFNSSFSFAEDDFAAHKAKATAEIDEHIKSLQDHKSCVSAAENKDGMRACREKMKEFRQSERVEHMEKRQERMQKRMDKMKERQNK